MLRRIDLRSADMSYSASKISPISFCVRWWLGDADVSSGRLCSQPQAVWRRTIITGFIAKGTPILPRWPKFSFSGSSRHALLEAPSKPSCALPSESLMGLRAPVCCRGSFAGPSPATSERFCRKWAPILPWVLGFWAVFDGGCSPLGLPTWGNAGAMRRFGSARPAKPPRSRKRGLRAARAGRQTLRSAPVARGASRPVLGKRDRKALARSMDHGRELERPSPSGGTPTFDVPAVAPLRRRAFARGWSLQRPLTALPLCMAPMLLRSSRDSFHAAEQRLMRCFVKLRVGQANRGRRCVHFRTHLRPLFACVHFRTRLRPLFMYDCNRTSRRHARLMRGSLRAGEGGPLPAGSCR